MLRREFSIDIRILGIASSSRMLLAETGIDLNNWQEDFASKSVPVDLRAFGDFLASNYIPNRCGSASPSFAACMSLQLSDVEYDVLGCATTKWTGMCLN